VLAASQSGVALRLPPHSMAEICHGTSYNFMQEPAARVRFRHSMMAHKMKTTYRNKLGLAVSLAGMVIGAGSATGKDWPQFRGPERDGKSSETGIIKSWESKAPALVWMGEGMGSGYAAVAVVGDRLYTTGDQKDGQAVVAVNAKDGKVVWSTTLTEGPPKHGFDGSRCTPTVVGDHLWVTTSNGQIACLTTDGKVVWKKDFKEWGGRMMSGWGFAESVLVDGNAAVFTPGGPDAMMVALDKDTGKELWKSKVPKFGDNKGKDGAGYSSIVISQGAGVKQYVQMTGHGVIGVRASDGKFLWGYDKTANDTANISSPVIVGADHVFSSSAYGAGAGLVKLSKDGDGVKAEEVYFLDRDQLQNHHGGMVLVNGYVYCGHKQNGGDLVCIDIKTGKFAWGPIKGLGKGSAAVTYADGHLIFRYQNGLVALVAANPKEFKLEGTFKQEFQQKDSWAYPVVSGGKLYLREQDKLMCYQL